MMYLWVDGWTAGRLWADGTNATGSPDVRDLMYFRYGCIFWCGGGPLTVQVTLGSGSDGGDSHDLYTIAWRADSEGGARIQP